MTEEIKEILEDNDELMVRYKDNSFECFDTLPKNVLDYITNLQNENEKLKETLQTDKLMKAFMVEHNRNEKAVEYIENDLQISVLPNNQIINGTEVVKRINKILNILEGGDK